MADNRFEVVHKESSAMSVTQILVDKLTGVNYLWRADNFGAGLTVLLDKDGKPVVTPYQIK